MATIGPALLRLGVSTWNTVQSLPFLRFRNFQEAFLLRADLRGADLRGADFRGASLHAANFRGANLEEANFFGANLLGVDFRGANLEGADFTAVAFIQSKLEEANFARARLHETSFSNVNLSSTKGLDHCLHSGPCSFDHRTFAQSNDVPIEFWQGCGLSDWQIEAAKLSHPGLTQDDVVSITYEVARLRGEQPIQLLSPFICYSSHDDDFAKKLYDRLQSNGVRCWFAPEDMKIGDRFRNQVDEAIHIHDKLLLVLSEHSVASRWVEKEVETALEKEDEIGEAVIFPIKLDKAVDGKKMGWAADIRRSRHIGDFTNWEDDTAFGTAFERVLRDLRADR